MNSAILSVKNVIKRFSGTVALKGVDMELYPNEILALVGENGAGKSTLMKILSGIYPYGSYEGELRLGDQLCRFQSPADSENAGIAMIYQELNVELDLTVGENILLGRYPRTHLGMIDWKRVHQEARAALDLLDVDIDTHVTVRNLNPSMQQLVSIVRALYRRPKILILDEPTSVLTEKEANGLMDILRGLKDKGISCIYISHKLDEIFSLCDRTVVFRDGEKISEYRKADGYDSPKVIEDMIGRHLDAMYPARRAHIGEEVLRVEHFRVPHPFAYGKSIIEDVSFSLKKGEILGLSGLVGAGRSELLNAIFKAQEDGVSGKVWLEGKRIDGLSLRGIKESGIGYLTEDRKRNGFIAGAAIRENIVLASLSKIVRGGLIDHKAERQYATEYFRKLSVKAPDIETPMFHLSGGNQQKVVLAKWMMTDLKVMFFDEPTRGIDVGAKTEIYRLISDMANQGIGIILVSSEMPELISMCDRFLVLSHGKFRAEFTKDNVSQEKIMKAATRVEEN